MGWRQKEEAKLAGKKVLMVGAGGIGCELLKNIVLCGFKDIHVIDLDTIDVSNLNRQFLFRREHVGRAKADVATSAGMQMAPEGVEITFDHDSIFSEKFNYDFYKQFALVLNALDNRSARNHVNRMCMANRIPLVDGGTAGYLGQVAPIVRGRTECYECVPKSDNVKTFPGCTIRNTPSEHIHCTVWSKHVFNQLFGEYDAEDEVSPDMDDEDAKEQPVEASVNGMEISEENGTNGSSTNGQNGGNKNGSPGHPGNTRTMAEASSYDPIAIYNKLFVEDITYLLRMEKLWKERRPPHTVPFEQLATENPGSSAGSKEAHAAKLDPHQKVWTPAESGEEFKKAVEALRQRKAESADGVLSWDKDDDDGMRFVAACANIRAGLFGIAPKSFFEIKSMAGNIIPAIATTNAIVAGVMTVEALKIMSGDFDSLRFVAVWQNPTVRGKILPDDLPAKPNPKCYTCSSKREVTVRVNLDEMSMGTLQETVIKGAIGLGAPDVYESTTGRILLSSEEGETDDVLEHKLAAQGLSSGSSLKVEDFDSGEEIRVVLLHAVSFDEAHFEVVSDVPAEKEEERVKEEEVEEKMEEPVVPGKKRKTLDEEDIVSQAKKARIEEDGRVAA